MAAWDRLKRFAGRVRNRDAVRGGYAAMIALLAFAAIEAYDIQQIMSDESVEIYRRHVREEDAIYRLRRALFLGSIAARDFLLNPNADRKDAFARQMAESKTEGRQALEELARLHGSENVHTDLRKQVEQFWTTLERTRQWSPAMRNSQAYDYIQQEVMPRRNQTAQLVRELAAANQRALETSESEFAATRKGATRRLLLMVGLCLCFGLVVAWVSLTYSESLERERDRQFAEVNRAKRDLEELSARLIEVQEEERKALSRELHDEIGQTLTALRIEISHAAAASNGNLPHVLERLGRARELAERTVQMVRNVALLLRPSMLDDLGLGAALEWLVEDFQRRTRVPCRFHEEGLDDGLPDAWKTCVYRVVQEALHNCERHSGASRVEVVVRQQNGWLTALVEDNGRGFDPHDAARQQGRLGIRGMRERAALLGGTLLLDSAQGKGARLTLRLSGAHPA